MLYIKQKLFVSILLALAIAAVKSSGGNNGNVRTDPDKEDIAK
jgi:hypothetical protein